MKFWTALLLGALLAAPLAGVATAQAPKPGSVGFRGKTYEPGALPAEVGDAAKRAVGFWAPWAKTRGYRLDLDPARRVLLLSTRSSVDAPLALVTRTVALFDGLFPAFAITQGPDTTPPGATPGAAAKPSAKKPGVKPGDPEDPDVVPEDPEGPPPGAPKTLPPERDDGGLDDLADPARPREAPFRPDSETAVMLIAKNSEDYGSALDHLAAAHPYLAEWKAEARVQIGFALGTPVCGAYNENSPGQEEWSPDNELVHRTMALLVLRRFSTQPFWLQTGLAWHAELAIQKSIYCMPYRDGFVGIGEHGGWLAELGSLYGNRAKEPLRMDELAMKRGVWNDRASKTALGMVDFLSRANPRALAGLMDELRRFADQDNRRANADGTWTRKRDYEVPLERQKEFLERYFGAKVLSAAIAHWTSGATPPK